MAAGEVNLVRGSTRRRQARTIMSGVAGHGVCAERSPRRQRCTVAQAVTVRRKGHIPRALLLALWAAHLLGSAAGVEGTGSAAPWIAALGTVGRDESLLRLAGGARRLRQAPVEVAAVDAAAASVDASLANLPWLKEPPGGWPVWQPPPGQNTPLTDSGVAVAADAASSATRDLAAQASSACWCNLSVAFSDA